MTLMSACVCVYYDALDFMRILTLNITALTLNMTALTHSYYDALEIMRIFNLNITSQP